MRKEVWFMQSRVADLGFGFSVRLDPDPGLDL